MQNGLQQFQHMKLNRAYENILKKSTPAPDQFDISIMEVLITLFYLLFSACVVYPPTEFVSAGFTIPQILEAFVGSESSNFVLHHIRRTCTTVMAHALLPLGYVLCMMSAGHWSEDPGMAARVLMLIALCAPLSAIARIIQWTQDGWRGHPIVINLMAYASDNRDWVQVANSIDSEFKSVDKICIQMNAVTKVVATSNWLIKTTLYGVHFAHHSDTTLVAVDTDSHDMSISGESETQYVQIKVQPERAGVKPFFIRINTLDFKDLQDKMSRPIIVLPTVNFHTSVLEKFIDVFRSHVVNNPEYVALQEVESCIGCMQTPSNVKIQKRCDEPPPPEHPCTDCHCRPMWCVECIARWWASRQAALPRETWLAARCSCPLCRATFCLLDVRPLAPPPSARVS